MGCALGINMKSDFNLSNTTEFKLYVCESKLAKWPVILGYGAFFFINLNEHT